MRTQLAKIALAAVFAALLPLMSCDAANNTSALAEHWRTEDERRQLGDMELFKDGTGVIELHKREGYSHSSSEVSVSWKVENGRFIIQSPSFAMTSDYKISDYKLTLIYNNGDSTIYLNEAYYAAFKAFEAIMEEATEAFKAIQKESAEVLKGEPNAKKMEVFAKAFEVFVKVFGYSDKTIAKAKVEISEIIAAADKAAKADKADKADKAAKTAGDFKAIMAEHIAKIERTAAKYEAATAKRRDKGAAAFKAAKNGGASYEAALEAAKVAIKAANNKESSVAEIEFLKDMF